MGFAVRFNEISRALVAFLLMDLALCYTMIPLNAFILFTDALTPLGVPIVALIGIVAWTISAPGVATAFAAYRDAPVLRSGEDDDVRWQRNRRNAGIEPIADSYWKAGEEDNRVLRPYVRTYPMLFVRSLIASLIFGVALAVLVETGLWGLNAGIAAVTGVCAVFAVVVLAMQLAALNLVVEFPHARYGAIARNASVLMVRKLPLLIPIAALLGTYGYVMLNWPWFMIVFGTGLVAFFLYHATEHVIRPLVDQMIFEETGVKAVHPKAEKPLV